MAVNDNRRRFSPGHIGLMILLLGGVWLLIAPTWVGFSGQQALRVDHWAGAALIIQSTVSLVVQGAFNLGDMVSQKRTSPND